MLCCCSLPDCGMPVRLGYPRLRAQRAQQHGLQTSQRLQQCVPALPGCFDPQICSMLGHRPLQRSREWAHEQGSEWS